MTDGIQIFNFKKLPIEIEVKDLKFVKELPELLGRPHKATFFQIVWLTTGEAVFNIDFKEITIKENELLIITPGQVCAFDVHSDYTGKLILFTNSFFSISEMDANFMYTSEIFNPVRRNKVISLCPILISDLTDLLENELKQGDKNYQLEIAQSYLRIILFESERQFSKTTNIPVNNVARLFYNAVEHHYKENKNTEFYVDLLNVNEKVLSREVKAIIGKTPKVYIDSRTILEAKRLLIYSNFSIKEVGYDLGFEEPSYFNKYFKKHTKLTPVEFRKEH
nr:helix-turn-helix transcriptional regulator [uncultured Carboxylicivirga sp.]